MSNISTPIEVIPGQLDPNQSYQDVDQSTLQRNRRRLFIFTIVFVLTALVGMGYTFLRSPVYQSTATLHIAPAAAFNRIDELSGVEQHVEVQRQYVEIQRQVLTSQPVLAGIRERLPQIHEILGDKPDTLSALRDMLDVVSLGDANMVELQAESSRRELLPELVNIWVEMYLEIHASSQKNSSESANTALRQQLQELEPKIATKRLELDAFRKQYDIVSMERDENQVLAQLKGINVSLNKAREEEALASAQLKAIHDSIAQGKPFVREQDQNRFEAIEQRAIELQERLREFEQRFTSKYMALDPDIMALTRNLKQLQEKLARGSQESQQRALVEAEQALVSAQAVVSTLQEKLETYKRTAMDFTTRFAEHTALQEELAQLELLYRQVQERAVQEEVTRQHEVPQVTILNLAVLPEAPIRPHYLRDASISLVGAVLLGLLAVWFYEFFNRPPRQVQRSESKSYFYAMQDPRLAATQPVVGDLPKQQPALEHRPLRELSEAEVSTLLEVAAPSSQLLSGLLLSGVSVDEVANLCCKHADLQVGELYIPGESARTFALSAFFKHELARQGVEQRSGEAPLWSDAQGHPLSAEDLTALISCLAHDAGLSNPAEVTPQVLRHTYLAYLVRQGVRLAELSRIAGHLSPTALAAYGALSPPGRGVALEQVELRYPALRWLSDNDNPA